MAKTISFVKGRGSLAHNNREFIADNVDPERTSWNVTYMKTPLKQAYEDIFGEAIAEYNAKQKRKDRQIDNYLNKIKNSGNNEKPFYEIVVQIGKKDDTGVLDENGKLSSDSMQASKILDQYVRNFQERNPNLILFNAVLHMDEATPHLHLDYIPVAHGYKTGLKTRNSLTKALKEMGIDPAVSQKDNETMHWQERERQHIMELCQERGVEIEILGVDRDDYTIPEYKQAMRAKEAAEAEIEILHAEKFEIENSMASMAEVREENADAIAEQEKILEEVTHKIESANRKISDTEKAMDQMMAAGKPVEKEIQEIRKQVTDVSLNFGKEPMVKMPKKLFEKMLRRYRVAGTFEELNRKYEVTLAAKQNKIDKLTEKIKELEKSLQQYEAFVGAKGLVNAFKEFLRPKSIIKQLKGTEQELKVQKRGEKNKHKTIANCRE